MLGLAWKGQHSHHWKDVIPEFALAARAHTSGGAQHGLQGWVEFTDWAYSQEKNPIIFFKNCIFALKVTIKKHRSPSVIPVKQSSHFSEQNIRN